jgi:CheY-like chemotaxis protein
MSDDKGKILIVDDDPDIVDALSLVLEGAGYQVRDAANAEEGLAAVERERPDLIVLDVMMPDGTEGFQFVWRLRNELPQAVQETPIVILTAIHGTTRLRFYPEASDGTYSPGEYLPVQGFIDKPVDPEDLLKKVATLLRGESAA